MSGKVTIPIYHGDDFERMADLRREVEIAKRKVDEAEREAEKNASTMRLGDDDDSVSQAKERYAASRAALSAFIDDAEPRAEMWVLGSIGHEEFRELLRDHPPRKITQAGEDGKDVEVTHPDDAAWEPLGVTVNIETFPKALLTFVDPEDDELRTVISPEFDSPTALRKRIKRLSMGEFESLWVAAYFRNTGAIADPKSSDFYDGARRSDVI